MTDSDISRAIDAWRPATLDIDGEEGEAVIALARTIVRDAQPAHVDQAQIAAGYVYRFLVWALRGGRPLDASTVDLATIDAYIAHLHTSGMKSGSCNSARSYLRRCSVEADGLQHRAPTTTTPTNIAARIERYTPDRHRISTALWAQIAEATRTAVIAASPRSAQAAATQLTVTSLFLAWSDNKDPDGNRFAPSRVEAFIAAGADAWTAETAPTYASAIRTVARANAPDAWPSATPSAKEVLAPYSRYELDTISLAIAGSGNEAKRSHLEAACLLGEGAGVIGIEAATVEPDDVLDATPLHLRVRGRRSRLVPLTDTHGRRLWELAEDAERRGDRYLLGGTTRRDQRQGILLAQLAAQGTPVEPRRLRLMWLVELVRLPLPLPAVLHIAGLSGPESLGNALAWAGEYDSAAAAHVVSRRGT